MYCTVLYLVLSPLKFIYLSRNVNHFSYFRGHPSVPGQVGRAARLVLPQVDEPHRLEPRRQPRLLEVEPQVHAAQVLRPHPLDSVGIRLHGVLLRPELREIQ